MKTVVNETVESLTSWLHGSGIKLPANFNSNNYWPSKCLRPHPPPGALATLPPGRPVTAPGRGWLAPRSGDQWEGKISEGEGQNLPPGVAACGRGSPRSERAFRRPFRRFAANYRAEGSMRRLNIRRTEPPCGWRPATSGAPSRPLWGTFPSGMSAVECLSGMSAVACPSGTPFGHFLQL